MSNNIFHELIIDRRTSKKISKQLSSQLEARLLTSDFYDGEAILNHKELANLLNLNEKDVLDAYKDLERKEFLDLSEIGKPIFTKHLRKLNLFDQVDFIEKEIKSTNKEASVEILDFEVVSLDEHDLIKLSEFKNKQFLKQVRLYKANNHPYVYLVEYFPVERFPKLLDVDKSIVGEHGNIYKDLFYTEYNIRFKELQRYLNVINYNGEIANIFDVKEKTSGFKIDLIYYDQDRIPFCYGNAYMAPNLYFDYKSKN